LCRKSVHIESSLSLYRSQVRLKFVCVICNHTNAWPSGSELSVRWWGQTLLNYWHQGALLSNRDIRVDPALTVNCSTGSELRASDNPSQNKHTATPLSRVLLEKITVARSVGEDIPSFLLPRSQEPATGNWSEPDQSNQHLILDAGARRKILCPCRGSNLDHPIVQPVVRHYTAWATAAHYLRSHLILFPCLRPDIQRGGLSCAENLYWVSGSGYN
jgi:hypothetical protein